MPYIDKNTYYPSQNIVIFPSSNSVDRGKLFTELNGRNITINITDRNYVVSPNPGGFDLTFSNNTINIAAGKAIINGFEVQTDAAVSHPLPASSDIVSEGEYSGYALLCLHTLFDSLENLTGNLQTGSVWYCGGITVSYVSYSDYVTNPNEYLLLGGIKEDGTIKDNDSKFGRIDAKYIVIKVEKDPETGAPPSQTTDLEDFVNNLLKGYWVSKVGDNEYGQLLFKSMPNSYLEEGFDYTTEDPLDSTKFGVKITKDSIILKPENEAATNKVIHLASDAIKFYTGNFAGDTILSADSKISSDKTTLSTDIYDNVTLFELANQQGGKIKLHNNDGLQLVVENSKANHNGVEAGKVIYGNVSLTNIADSDSTTEYDGNINYLVDKDGNIKSANKKNSVSLVPSQNSNAALRFTDTTIGISELKQSNKYWGNNTQTLETSNHLVITGNLATNGYIAAVGADKDPTTVTVPDVENGYTTRPLNSTDIYSIGQVWSAVYNDYAEIFRIHPQDANIIKPGCILAVDMENPDYYVLADNKKNNVIVGVVSENPAYCAGGDDCQYGVPVALAGRVNVKIEDGCEFKIGDYVSVSNIKAGYGTVVNSSKNKETVGRIIKIIDKNTARIIVK